MVHARKRHGCKARSPPPQVELAYVDSVEHGRPTLWASLQDVLIGDRVIVERDFSHVVRLVHHVADAFVFGCFELTTKKHSRGVSAIFAKIRHKALRCVADVVLAAPAMYLPPPCGWSIISVE